MIFSKLKKKLCRKDLHLYHQALLTQYNYAFVKDVSEKKIIIQMINLTNY